MSTPEATTRMEAEVRRQAGRLREQLAQLDASGPLALDPAPLERVAAAASALREALADTPSPLRSLLTSAELGFMPGPGLEAFAPRHAQEWDKELGSLAEGARAVAAWRGTGGREARRNWLVRGYIRGFAHQWRLAGRGEPDVEGADRAFLDFAATWLHYAGVTGDPARRCRAALGKGWRLAAD